VQIYSRGNYLFNLQNKQKHILRLICEMEVDDVTRGDKMTRAREVPGDEMTGDEMTRGRNDRDEMTGDEMKGAES
jgi:hypothetical protein